MSAPPAPVPSAASLSTAPPTLSPLRLTAAHGLGRSPAVSLLGRMPLPAVTLSAILPLATGWTRGGGARA